MWATPTIVDRDYMNIGTMERTRSTPAISGKRTERTLSGQLEYRSRVHSILTHWRYDAEGLTE